MIVAVAVRARAAAVTQASARRLLTLADMKRIADALELLTAQHEAISGALTKISTVEGSGLVHALGALADQVTTHLSIEEQFLTMLGISVPAFAHDELRLALTEILASDMASPDLSARVEAFAVRWTTHAAAQDQTFISLAELVTPAVLEDIGLQLGAWSEKSRCLAA